jgi:hypothetical protein
MGAIYRFDLVGKSGGTMGGHIVGEYTVETALAWALDDLATGRAVPFEIIRAYEDGGGVAYDAAAIQAAADRAAGGAGA